MYTSSASVMVDNKNKNKNKKTICRTKNKIKNKCTFLYFIANNKDEKQTKKTTFTLFY